MRERGYSILPAIFVFGGAGTSGAQERGHVAGVIGMTFGTETSAMYGAQFGVGVSNTISWTS